MTRLWTEEAIEAYYAKQRMERGVVGTRTSTGTAKGERDSACLAKAGLSKPVRSNPASPSYKSKWEAAYAAKLELEKRAKVIKDYTYENLTFKLAHRQYHRNDFLIWHLDGSIEIAQVKGYHKNMRAGIKGLKWAAKINPWFTWTLKWWTGTGWDGCYVEV